MQISKTWQLLQILAEPRADPAWCPWRLHGSLLLRCGFDAVVNTFADPCTCTIGTLVSCLLVDAHCFTFYYYFVVVVVDESFMDVLKTDVSSLRFFRFWRFNSTKSSNKKRILSVVYRSKEQLDLLKRSIFIFELFLEKSSTFSYENTWKSSVHRAKSFFERAMSSQMKLIILKVSPATVVWHFERKFL